MKTDNPTQLYNMESLTWGPCVLQIRISEDFSKETFR